MFGYVEGSFTDARKGGKIGLFELAHRGTIFLDEIAEMSLVVQAKVLRALQEKEVIKLGDNNVVPIDIRVIAATNANLWERVIAGTFREDLYYRVNVLTLEIPPLVKRDRDSVILARNLCQKSAPDLVIESDAFEPVLDYEWPGNVRELYNFIEQIIVLNEEQNLTRSSVQEFLAQLKLNKYKVTNQSSNNSQQLTDQEIINVLSKFKGNKTMAANFLGMSRSTLWRRLKNIQDS